MEIDCHNDFVFPGHLDAVSAARETVMDFLRKHCSMGPDEFDILVALQEALANAALHGCGNDSSKLIRCSVSVKAGVLTIVVCDPGTGFNERDHAETESAEPNYSESGRGILLMRGLMDEVTYQRGGSEVQLKKRLAPSMELANQHLPKPNRLDGIPAVR
jgi:anti-sigma regulatory factor (Ser/Thr protein kinase)